MLYVFLGILVILFIVGISIIIYCNNVIKVNVETFVSEKIDKDIDIVFVSDFHVGRFMKRKELKSVISSFEKC